MRTAGRLESRRGDRMLPGVEARLALVGAEPWREHAPERQAWRTSSIPLHTPAPIPARYAAPSAVACTGSAARPPCRGRRRGTAGTRRSRPRRRRLAAVRDAASAYRRAVRRALRACGRRSPPAPPAPRARAWCRATGRRSPPGLPDPCTVYRVPASRHRPHATAVRHRRGERTALRGTADHARPSRSHCTAAPAVMTVPSSRSGACRQPPEDQGVAAVRRHGERVAGVDIDHRRGPERDFTAPASTPSSPNMPPVDRRPDGERHRGTEDVWVGLAVARAGGPRSPGSTRSGMPMCASTGASHPPFRSRTCRCRRRWNGRSRAPCRRSAATAARYRWYRSTARRRPRASGRRAAAAPTPASSPTSSRW